MNEQIKLKSTDHDKIKSHIISMLREFDRICKNYNIKYSIFGGTLLGAIRHKGFIPWDDDADIFMLRQDYERFKKISNQMDPNICYFQDHDTDKEYLWGYGKIRKSGTEYVRVGQEHINCKTGVFIDIFPLDYVPNTLPLQMLQDFHCFLIRKLMWARVGRVSESNPIKKILYNLICMVPIQFAFKQISFYIKLGQQSLSDNVRVLCYTSLGKLYYKHPLTQRYGIPRKWFTDLDSYYFEGLRLLGPKNYDEVLKFEFGQYMEIPPEEKRQQHSPVSKIKL